MKDFLALRLRRVIRRHQSLRLARSLTFCWVAAALVGFALVLVQRQWGWSSPLAFPLLAGVTLSVAAALIIRSSQTRPDDREIAKKIETAYPDLRGLLLTAVQQSSDAREQGGYLQDRVLQQAVNHAQQTQGWNSAIPRSHVRRANLVQFAALALLVAAIWQGRTDWKRGGAVAFGMPPLAGWGVTVTPGDTSIERGESLVVLARFGSGLPAGVELVVNDANAPARKIPLVKSLADPVFGGSVAEVANDFTYRLEYGGEKTRDFTVKVYEHPRLARADAELKFPDYTKLQSKRIEDTRRVSAVEGSELALTLQLNKPVTSAVLVARNKEKTQIPLTVVEGKGVATLTQFPLTASQSYDLKLVDAEGRANKVSAPFFIEVVPNRPPEIKLAAPRGDVRPSALEEVVFEGTVWDDFGSPAYGLSYTITGQEPKVIELGRDVPAKERRSLNQLVRLEELGTKPDDLISWFVWADDVGPDGQVRRTSSDMFFAEIRPFDEVFRESQAMQSEDQNSQQQGGGAPSQRLAELQKQIISATWKLQRQPKAPKYAEDAAVVHESQEQALAQAQENLGKATTPNSQGLWNAVAKEMEAAVKQLNEATKSPAALSAALKSEQAAYQALLKLQARETDVTRSRRRSQGGGGGGQQANQRQIDELDIAQNENRYETQRQAKSPQSPERREQNQILNRLQELARRQQDVNERLKELQTALQAANTEQEKEDVRRQLKRLQEEQQQMLADMDEVKQRMDRPENQSAMQQQREQLDQTRDDVQRAAEATGQGSVSQALAAGTRAERQLEQMRDELRKQNSSEFSEELREMRTQARELAQQQEELNKKIADLDQPKKKTLNDTPEREAAIQQVEEQRKRMNDLVDRATLISEQAENSEPLLSRQLYDSVRKVAQDDAKNSKDMRQELLEQGMLSRALNERLQKSDQKEESSKTLELAGEMLRQSYLTQASQAGQRAETSITDLRRGVERAAESVLGDDAQALKLAQAELDAVTEQLKQELAQAGAENGQPQPDQPGQPGQQPGEPGQRGQNGQTPAPDQRQANNSPQPRDPNQPGANGQAQPGQPDPNGQNPGQPGQQQSPGQPGQGQAQAQQGQQGQGQGQGQPGGRADPANRESQPQVARNGRSGQRQPQQSGGGGGGGGSLENLLSGAFDRNGDLGNGPITGGDFGAWADRLRDVEQLVEEPGLRDAVANARERARLLRQDFKRDLKKPDWAVVQLQILKPLLEVRSRIGEELARRDSKDALVPIDRDPVPTRYVDSVRRYYEELGKEK